MPGLKEIYVSFRSDTKDLSRGLKKADSQISSVKKSLVRLGAAIGGVFAVRGLVRGFQGTILDAKELIDTARGVGVATQEYERLAFVMRQLGATPTSLKQAFGDLQLRIEDTGRLYDKFFKQIGLDPNQVRKLDPGAQLTTVLKALARVEGQARRAAVAGRVLGEESSRQLLKVVNAGVDEIERVSKTFVPSIAPEQEAAIDKYVEDIGRIEQAWTRVKTQAAAGALTEKNIQRVEEFAEALAKVSREVDLIKLAIPLMVAAGVAALAALYAAVGLVGTALAAASAGIATLVINWDDLGRSIEWVWEKLVEKIEGFNWSALSPFRRPQEPPVSLQRPELAGHPGFSKTISPQIVNQYFTAPGLTPEQVSAYGRRTAAAQRRGAKAQE